MIIIEISKTSNAIKIQKITFTGKKADISETKVADHVIYIF